MEDNTVWSQQEQTLLDNALHKFQKDSYLNSKDRWRDIALMTGRSARECILRYQHIRNELKAKSVALKPEEKPEESLVESSQKLSKDKLREVEPKKEKTHLNANASVFSNSIQIKESKDFPISSQKDVQGAEEASLPVLETNKNKEESLSSTSQEETSTLVKKKVSKIKPCRYFKSKGSCRNGSNCQYSHDVIPPPSPPSSSSSSSKIDKIDNSINNNIAQKKDVAIDIVKRKENKQNKKDITENKQSIQPSKKNMKKSQLVDQTKINEDEVIKKQKTTKKTIEKKKIVLCRNFLAPKGCNKGDQCKFSHVIKGDDSIIDDVAIEKDNEEERKLKVIQNQPEDIEDAKKKNKKKKKKKPDQTTSWWQKLEDIDPISLEPIADLSYPPFELSNSSADTLSRGHLYDGRLLALYFVASGIFEDPMNRRELTADECTTLDDYLKKHRLGPPWPQVASAFKLKGERKANEAAAMAGAMPRSHGRSSNEARASVLQREAAGLLLSMFGISVAQDGPARGTHRRQPRRREERQGGSGDGGEMRRAEEHMMGGGGHAMIDDDLAPYTPSSTSQQNFLQATAGPAFPSLPETANKVVAVPWVKAKTPTPQTGAPHTHKPTNQEASEGVLMRNIRMKEALGLGGGGGGASVSLERAAQERQACVWPPLLRKWYAEKSGEVIKIERKLSELLNDMKGTSIALKPMPREERRLCHLLGEFYEMNTRSDDNNDLKGKCITFIKNMNSNQPWPLLSDVFNFERKYPELIAKSLKYQAELEFEKQKEIDLLQQNENGNLTDSSSNCLLLKNVPDLLSISEIRKLILLFVEIGEVIDLWQIDIQSLNHMGSTENGLEYCAVLKNEFIADKVLKLNLMKQIPLPFTIQRYPSLHMTQKPIDLISSCSGKIIDSWDDVPKEEEGNDRNKNPNSKNRQVCSREDEDETRNSNATGKDTKQKEEVVEALPMQVMDWETLAD